MSAEKLFDEEEIVEVDEEDAEQLLHEILENKQQTNKALPTKLSQFCNKSRSYFCNFSGTLVTYDNRWHHNLFKVK